MAFNSAIAHQDPSLQDYFAGVSSACGVRIEILAPDGPVYSNCDTGSERYPLLATRFSGSSGIMLEISIYHPGGDQHAMSEADRLIRVKLADYLELTELTQALLTNYDKLNTYRGLAEQMLQAEDQEGALDLLLTALETLVKAGRCGLLAAAPQKGKMKLVGIRAGGKSPRPAPANYYRTEGTSLERYPAGSSSYCFYDSVTETLQGEGAPDIVFKGPYLAAPILSRRPGAEPEVLGMLFASEAEAGVFTNNDQHAIATISSLAAVVMRHFSQLETTRRATTEMDTMLTELMATFTDLQRQSALIEQVNRISVRINSTLDLGVIFNSIADYSRNLLEGDCALVAVMGGNFRVSFPGVAGVGRQTLPSSVIPPHGSILARTFITMRHGIKNNFDPNKDDLGFKPPFAVRNLIAYPIESKGAIVAVIVVFNRGGGEKFADVHADLLKALAYQATTAIENARLLNNLKQTQFTMMGKLSELAEKRDPETGEHLLRMQKYCRIIAAELAKSEKHKSVIDENFINEIYVASPLHDIGKVAISDAVLLKRGKLSGDEWEVMMTHAAVGEEILRGPDYLKMASEIAGAHHEKFDGSGYPRRLKGADIPLCARIVAVADVYDALTSKRVYKEDMSHELAMEIINEGTGRHFDPDIIEALKRSIGDVVTIKNLIR